MRAVLFVMLSLVSLASMTGCGQGQHSHGDKSTHGDHEPDKGEPEEEPKTAQISVWTDRHEAFVEHRLIVVNEPTQFITHITDLKTLEPRREGPMSFEMKHQSGDKLEHPQAQPDRAGIYLPKVTFPKTGEWELTVVVPIEGGVSRIPLPKITVYASAEEVKKAPEPEAPEGISFLKEQQWKILSRTDPVQKKTLVERVRVSASVSSRPQSKASVTPPVAGALSAPANGALPILGQRVEAGQVIALVQPPVVGVDLLTVASNQFQIKALETEFTVKAAEVDANAIKEKVAVDQAQQLVGRLKKLVEEGARSRRELDEAEFGLKTAQANLAAADAMKKSYEAARLRLSSIPQPDIQKGFPALEIRAPISGTIIATTAHIGASVTTEQVLFSILDTGTVFIEAKVSETDLGRIKPNASASYELPFDKETSTSITNAGGKLLFVGNEIDPSTRTVSVVYEVPNPNSTLKVGMSLLLSLESSRAEEAIAIPRSALVDEDGSPIVFVQLGGETFEKRNVTLGFRDGDYVQVLSGVSAGERIVTKGAYAVRLSSVSNVIPAHGHAH